MRIADQDKFPAKTPAYFVLTLWNDIAGYSERDAVLDDRLFVPLCGILGDRVSFVIIYSTIRDAKTAAEISRESDVPLSSVYRKVRKLERLGIIQSRVSADRNGKKIAYYTCRIKALKMSVDEDGGRLWLKANAG